MRLQTVFLMGSSAAHWAAKPKQRRRVRGGWQYAAVSVVYDLPSLTDAPVARCGDQASRRGPGWSRGVRGCEHNHNNRTRAALASGQRGIGQGLPSDPSQPISRVDSPARGGWVVARASDRVSP